jgi:hypothetical protein
MRERRTSAPEAWMTGTLTFASTDATIAASLSVQPVCARSAAESKAKRA